VVRRERQSGAAVQNLLDFDRHSLPLSVVDVLRPGLTIRVAQGTRIVT
jgi:hypothetical protein